MLTDTGVLYALIDSSDKGHDLCANAAKTIRSIMVTTWPCFAEAMHVLSQRFGHHGQEALWTLIDVHGIEFHINDLPERAEMRRLMSKYRDTPMDLADASLVAAADALKQTKIFTLDSDFHVYQRSNGAAFEVIP